MRPIRITLSLAITAILIITNVQANSVSVENNGKKTTLLPSHDTFIRKDYVSKSHGKGSKIAVTKQGANQRVGLMKFDTSNHLSVQKFKNDDEISTNTKAYLRLSVAETNKEEPVQIKILRLDNDFDEDHVSWRNFDGMADVDNYVEFTIEGDHENKIGQVEVSNLIIPGEDTILAFVIEDQGHVKFHSKDNELKKMAPSLILEEL